MNFIKFSNVTLKMNFLNCLLKFELLLWKIFNIRLHHIIISILELAIITLGILLPPLVQTVLGNKTVYVNKTEIYPITNMDLNDLSELRYAPENMQTSKIMDKVKELAKSPYTSFRGYKSENELMLGRFDTDIVAVVFKDVNKTELPKILDYKIRSVFPADYLSQKYSEFPLKMLDMFSVTSMYFICNFISVQQAIDAAFINLHKTVDVKVSLQRMPLPPYYTDLISGEEYATWLIMMYVITIYITLTFIIEEKKTGVRELMKIMGLSNWMFWLGHYLNGMTGPILTLPLYIFYKIGLDSTNVPTLFLVDGFMLFIFMYIFCNSIVFYTFLLSSFFNNLIIGEIVAALMWMLPSIIFDLVEISNQGILSHLILIHPVWCVRQGLHTMYEYSNKGRKLGWSKLFSAPKDSFSLGVLLIALIVDCVIFMLLCLYIDNINPGPYGYRKPWNFLWQKKHTYPVIEEESGEKKDAFEKPPAGLEAEIQIQNLHKNYKAIKAVDGLNINIYENQITVLLGHNGAGKTTTMNILTGLQAPTAGTVLFHGQDIRTNLGETRKLLGLCPQANMHFSYMSVENHLIFVARLKGLSISKAKEEARYYMKMMNMEGKKDWEAKKLSGGQMRRLSLGMAFAGNPKILMLDEPTSGMDPEARRELWDILLSLRGSRTILLTTHLMEEADVLGDRIAIMHSGHLMCYGTPLFLKKFYGLGYVLSVLVRERYNLESISTAVKSQVEKATVQNAGTSSIKYQIPTNDTSVITKLLESLESNKDSLKIIGMGISIIGIDDVFLKVGEMSEKGEKKKQEAIISIVGADELLTGFGLLLNQFYAIFKKKALYHMHKWINVAFAIVLFTVIIILMHVMIRTEDTANALALKLDIYKSTSTYYSTNDDKLKSYYEKIVKEQSSIPIKTSNVIETLIKWGTRDVYQFHKEAVVAAEFGGTSNALYGCDAVHSPAISLNLITNALLKKNMDDDKYAIEVENHPVITDTPFGSGLQGTIFLVGIMFYAVQIIVFTTHEQSTGVKQLQMNFGTPRNLYWLANLFSDMLFFTLLLSLSLIIMVIFKNAALRPVFVGYFVLIWYLFALSFTPFVYLHHYWSENTALIVLFMSVLFISILIPIFTSLISIKGVKTARHVFMAIFPQYNFVDSLNILISRSTEIKHWHNMDKAKQQLLCAHKHHDCCVPQSKECMEFYNLLAGEETNSIKMHLWILALQILCYIVLLMLFDYGYLGKFWNILPDMIWIAKLETLDSDVLDEKNRILNSDYRHGDSGDMLRVVNLRKRYNFFPSTHAVKELTFGVKQGECFGLLGVNGAGKTTTFKMLTGEIFPSGGMAYLFDYSLFRNKTQYLKHIGYCPQFDPFNEALTTRQMLTLFAEIRGVPRKRIEAEVTTWLERFDILKYEKMICVDLSGGNKRKLTAAIAFIGDPPLLFLDEPTSGVDPMARRNIWKIINTARKAGHSFVLASHSMDECENLCDRLTVMVNGQMMCLGNITYLKLKFAMGVTLELSIQSTDGGQGDVDYKTQVENLKSIIENKFTCELKDAHLGMLLYHITEKGVTVAKIFKFAQNLKTSESIVQDFTVCDTSLEQIFLAFAKAKNVKINYKAMKSRSQV